MARFLHASAEVCGAKNRKQTKGGCVDSGKSEKPGAGQSAPGLA
nr:MAG TPA: hypothetical protein [Caudoviricetes sp.]